MAGALNDVLTFCSKMQKMVKDVQSIVHQVVSVAEYVSLKEHRALNELQRVCQQTCLRAVVSVNIILYMSYADVHCVFSYNIILLQVSNNDPYKLASNQGAYCAYSWHILHIMKRVTKLPACRHGCILTTICFYLNVFNYHITGICSGENQQDYRRAPDIA